MLVKRFVSVETLNDKKNIKLELELLNIMTLNGEQQNYEIKALRLSSKTKKKKITLDLKMNANSLFCLLNCIFAKLDFFLYIFLN